MNDLRKELAGAGRDQLIEKILELSEFMAEQGEEFVARFERWKTNYRVTDEFRARYPNLGSVDVQLRELEQTHTQRGPRPHLFHKLMRRKQELCEAPK